MRGCFLEFFKECSSDIWCMCFSESFSTLSIELEAVVMDPVAVLEDDMVTVLAVELGCTTVL